MKQFHIYHSVGDNRFTETPVQPREYAGVVMAESVEQAYVMSQNGELPWNQIHPTRSTSVGDVIHGENDKFYLVCGMGFKVLGEPAVELNGDMAQEFNNSQDLGEYEDDYGF